VTEYQTQPELMALAQAIARELNTIDSHTWTALNGYTHVAHIQAQDDRKFGLHTSGYRFQMGDRLEISGSYARKDTGYGFISSYDHPPSIGVTSSRPPKALARDIQRRFLPEFHRFHELAMERKRQHEEYEANQEKAAQVIAEAFEGEIRNDNSGVRFSRILNDGPWGHIDVSGNGTVMIEIRDLPVDLAVQIGHLLKA
jgi:hypothetical protein